VVGDFGAWDFANIAVRFFAEVCLIGLLGKLVPLGGKDTFAPRLFEGESRTADASEEVYKCELSLVWNKLIFSVRDTANGNSIARHNGIGANEVLNPGSFSKKPACSSSLSVRGNVGPNRIGETFSHNCNRCSQIGLS